MGSAGSSTDKTTTDANSSATPIHDTPICDFIMRPKVETPVEHGYEPDFWVEYPSGLVDLSRKDHLPSGSSATTAPPALKSSQMEIEVNGGRTIRVEKETTAIVIVDMQKCVHT